MPATDHDADDARRNGAPRGQVLLDGALLGFLWLWSVLALLVSAVATLNLFLSGNPFRDPGAAVLVPIWLMFETVLFSPAIVALLWRRHRRRERARP